MVIGISIVININIKTDKFLEKQLFYVCLSIVLINFRPMYFQDQVMIF